MSNAYRPTGKERAQRLKLQADNISPYAATSFARCGCGTIEHLLMGESGDRFFCCDCRAMRVAIIITARKRKAA